MQQKKGAGDWIGLDWSPADDYHILGKRHTRRPGVRHPPNDRASPIWALTNLISLQVFYSVNFFTRSISLLGQFFYSVNFFTGTKKRRGADPINRSLIQPPNVAKVFNIHLHF
jgi:hypothetical protein